jgi:3-hydroxyisobutyrate dehydrogenase-like beta-hydroxyacid dehydrogenase
MDVGFIGLGNMGQAMVANLLAAGHKVRVWNRSPEPLKVLVEKGAQSVASPSEAFAGEAVVSMLGDDAALQAVILESGALEQAKPGLVHVNMATISVAFARVLAHAHRKYNVAYVAAPVLGRPDVAAAAKLNILAAGPADQIARVQPLFDAMGQKTWSFGDDASRANAVKLAVNFMLCVAVEATAEAAALVEAYGVAAPDLIQLITNSAFPGPVYSSYGKLIAEDRYEPALFKANLGLKDIKLALEAAAAVQTTLPIGNVVRDALLQSQAAGDGEKDMAVLGRLARQRAGRE